nr:hypothetical protein [Neorhizobium tomejilense]
MSEVKRRLNPLTLLRQLPEVIETRDVRVVAGWEKKTASEAIFRWVRAGYVSQFAKEVYFNLIVAPKAPETHVFEAAQRTLRRPMMLVGASALSAAGWTTQMPAGRELAVVVNRDVRTWRRMAGFTAEARTMTWYDRIAEHVIRKEDDFDVLPPALALVDSIAAAARFNALPANVRAEHQDNGTVNWHPDPDDICVPLDRDPDDVWQELQEAAVVLGVPFETVRDYASAIPDLDGIVTRDVRELSRQPKF